MEIKTVPFLRQQRAPIQEPKVWDVPGLLAVYLGCELRQDELLSPEEIDRRLADAYAQTPEQTIATAIRLVRKGKRAAALGAAEWLPTLGPAAASALEALEALKQRRIDLCDANRWEIEAAAEFIRKSMQVTPDGGVQGLAPDQVRRGSDWPPTEGWRPWRRVRCRRRRRWPPAAGTDWGP